LAGHLRRSFFRGVASSGPITRTRRGRGAAAAGPDRRDGNLDCRLCSAPLPRDAARMSCCIDNIATLWYIVRSFTDWRSDICTRDCRWLVLAGLDRVAARRKHYRLGPSLYFACISRRARARSRVSREKKMKLDCFGTTWPKSAGAPGFSSLIAGFCGGSRGEPTEQARGGPRFGSALRGGGRDGAISARNTRRHREERRMIGAAG